MAMSRQPTARTRRSKMRVFIVDDHPIVRHGIAQLINQQPDLMVCGEADDGRQALTQITTIKPDVAIVDLTLRRANGLELIKNLRVMHPQLPVLVLSIHDESVYAERAIRAGAKGYLMKQEATENVLTAIRTVLRGEVFLSAKMQPRLSATPKNNKVGNGLTAGRLTDRELEILWLLGKGNGTRQIASELHLSTSTVETHREHIKRKLALPSSIALLQHASRWVEDEDAG